MLSYAALLFKSKKEEKTDGKAWIKNKKVFVKDEKGLGNKPVICPAQGITVIVNNKEYNSPVSISEMDKVELKTSPIFRKESIEVCISENQAEVWLKTTPEQVIRYEILDSQPSNRLEIKTLEVFQNVKLISAEDIYYKLSELNISTGIHDQAIIEACKTYTKKELLIASSMPAALAEDAWVEYFFTGTDYEVTLNENKYGKVDFKNTVDYKSSQTGDILAVKHSMKYGEAGISVTGGVINPGTPKDITLKAGNGVVIEGNGRIARCIKPGKAQKKIDGSMVTISINENLEINKNIDIRTGNVKFSGNVIVNGSIKEAMEVASNGNINVNGDSLFSLIKSDNNIEITGNVISSKIETTEIKKISNSPCKYFDPAIALLGEIIYQIESSCGGKSLHDIYPSGISAKVKEIIRARDPKFYNLIKNLITALKTRKYEHLNEKAEEMITALKILMNNCEDIKTLDQLYEIKAIISWSTYILMQGTEKEGNVNINYAVNSSINAKGNVRIGIKGCINCLIYSKGKVIISGIVRGGKIHSDQSVELTQVGSSTGTSTTISVSENGTIKADKVYAETVIKVGDFSYRFIETEEKVNAHIEDGKIVLR
ncbi:MAG: flagellar assembly protein A [Ignavibacteriales bacterium]